MAMQLVERLRPLTRWPATPFEWLRLVAAVVVVLVVLPYLLTPLYLAGRPVSTPMLARWLTRMPVERSWVPIADIDPDLVKAVIAAEDGRFCQHWGIDFAEIRDALEDGLDDARGASTLSQQTAKNLFLWSGRSYVRKVLEAPLAMWLDLVLGKRRLMEIYLNIAEWGPNGQFGAEAAARRAFGKPADSLTRHQAALLAATLPNPVKRNAAKPGRGLQRLAGLYVRRARQAVAGCVLDAR